MSEQLAERPQSVKDFLALPSYRDRFHEVMGKRANQFMASIVASAQMPALKDAEPRSVIAAAMVAATLDLPVNPTLGMAHIVAYGDRTGAKIAQFQCGYKGFIQLALRSGQYKRLNAGPVNSEVFIGYDLVGEPKLDWSEFDPIKETGGYFCAFELLNGFTKVVYWPKKQVEAHAKRFSKAYQKGYQTSPWFSDFDSMATKTVIKNALTKWGILSVEMQKAATHDQGVQDDVDADVKYVDGATLDIPSEANPDVDAPPAPARPVPPPRAKKGAAAVQENAKPAIDVETVPPKPATVTVQPTEQAPPPVTQAATPAPKASEPVKAPEAKPEGPRTTLKDKETITANCTVKKVYAMIVNFRGTPTPAVQAEIAGDFSGMVVHINGSKQLDDKSLVADPVWAEGNKVSLSLIGQLAVKTGKINVIVEKIAPAEAAADTPPDVE